MGNLGFIDGRFVYQKFLCECGRTHTVPIQEIFVERGAIEELCAILNRLDLGKRCVFIADLNTLVAAGERVLIRLQEAGYAPRLCLFDSRDQVKADEYAAGKVLLDIGRDTQFLIVVGSGTLTDLTRYVSSRTGIPFVVVPTAASMDGYASSGASMLQGGFKRTILATHPHAIIADVDVICRAPYDMTIAGVNDMLGKLNARVDWTLGHLITGEYYCDYFATLLDGVVRMCVDNIARIKKREPDIMTRLMEGLILSGIAMLEIGNSRPASGSEHNLAHYWEMKALLEARPSYFYGTNVGVATGVMAKFYEKFFARNPAEIDLADVKARKRPLEKIEDSISLCLGPAAGGGIEVARGTYLPWKDQQCQIRALQDGWNEIYALKALEPSCTRLASIQRAIGSRSTPEDIGVNRALLRETLLNAKDVRSRYTVLRAAETLGWLNEIVDDVVTDLTCHHPR